MVKEYECLNCGRKVAQLLSLTDKEEAIICSVCGSKEMKITSIEEKKPSRGMGAKNDK